MDSLVEKARADLARLEAREADLHAELAQLHTEKQRIETFLELADEIARRYQTEAAHGLATVTSGPVPPEVQETTESVNTTGGLLPAVERPRFFGQSLPVAAASLIQISGKPLTENEILEGLEDGGVKMVSGKPLANLRFALRRRPDLVRYEGGKWHALADVTTLPPPPTGAVPNRSPEQHLRKTMEGLAAAKERGVIGGRRPTFNAAQRERVFALLAEGKSVAEVADAVGASKSLIYLWRRNAKAGAGSQGRTD